jgi:penicillin-binding protein 2
LTGIVPRQMGPGDHFAPRIRIATILMLVCLGALVARLWYLQLMEGESYVEMAKGNRMRLVRLPPSRGSILDCKGRVLARNVPSFTASVIPGELDNLQDAVETCSPILGLTPERLRLAIERGRSVPRFMNYPVKKNMTLEEVSLINSRIGGLKGIVVEAKPVRRYPMNDAVCHVIGTLGEITQEELSKSARQGYRTGDLVGKTGIEKEYEAYLRGEDGWEQIEIDAKGHQLTKVLQHPPRTGHDVVLTVDGDLQRYAEDIFIHRAGAIVAVDPDTGRVLVSVSKPGFDLNLFSPSITERQWKILNSDVLNPLENRVIRGLYAPASTFKVVTAAATLAEHTGLRSQTVICKGEMELWGQTFRCWHRHGHGKVDLHRAMVESCDIFFYECGLSLGPERLARYAALFGLGKPTGLGLPHELPGLIPNAAWKLRTYGDSWKDGETVNFSIGQGYVVATPLQLAMMTAALANGGKMLRPAIVRQIRSADGAILFDHTPVVRWTIPLSVEDRGVLASAMLSVVEDARGTGKKAQLPGIKIAAKTGTSQVIRDKQGKKEGSEIPYHERTHAIFVAYVDDRPKKIAVAVVVEHGGGGGASAAPLARKVIARYYGQQDPGDTDQ